MTGTEPFDPFGGELSVRAVESVLVDHGELAPGDVLAVHAGAQFETLLSTFEAFEIEYAEGVGGLLPTRMLVKTTEGEWFPAGCREGAFYDAMRATRGGLPILRCFGVQRFNAMQQCRLLLEDLTETHFDLLPRSEPPRHRLRQSIEALALIHSHWWGTTALDAISIPALDALHRELSDAKEHLPLFVDRMAGIAPLSKDRLQTLELLIVRIAGIVAQRLEPRRHTLVHGDAHLGNFLFPRDDRAEHCVVIDWQRWGIGLAASDLAYMIALHWPSELRMRLERDLIEHYASVLAAQGVASSSEEVWLDYRVAVSHQLLQPVLLHARLPEAIWRSHLERGFAAFTELDCRALL